MNQDLKTKNRTVALIVAAGRGSRSGAEMPKQYVSLSGKPVLRWSIEAFLAHPAMDEVYVVIHPEDHPFYEKAVEGLALHKPIAGDVSRQGSVKRGLEAIAAAGGAKHVLIHDAARPFVSPDVISRLLKVLELRTGAIPVLAVTDSLCRGSDIMTDTAPRDNLWRVQTPQAFQFEAIFSAHQKAPDQFTDDAGVLRHHGGEVALVEGDEDMMKVTLPEDWRRAEQKVSVMMSTRTGLGYDVHRLGPGDHVWLCGVRLDHDAALIGHSDADVALHALTDAVLGALCAGDIGHHFPPSDPKWKGAPSWKFLDHARQLVAQRGGIIEHVDVTIICERPKIGPHRDAFIARLAEILMLPSDRISVKATTTEGLGFTGRQEGIAAQAVATLRLPM